VVLVESCVKRHGLESSPSQYSACFLNQWTKILKQEFLVSLNRFGTLDFKIPPSQFYCQVYQSNMTSFGWDYGDSGKSDTWEIDIPDNGPSIKVNKTKCIKRKLAK
jgi:hypothetical protein